MILDQLYWRGAKGLGRYTRIFGESLYRNPELELLQMRVNGTPQRNDDVFFSSNCWSIQCDRHSTFTEKAGSKTQLEPLFRRMICTPLLNLDLQKMKNKKGKPKNEIEKGLGSKERRLFSQHKYLFPTFLQLLLLLLLPSHRKKDRCTAQVG
jgi:hypothetical protein